MGDLETGVSTPLTHQNGPPSRASAAARARSCDNDTLEKFTVLCKLTLEVYKVGIGTFLSWFVPHHCFKSHSGASVDADEASSEARADDDSIIAAGFACGSIGDTRGDPMEFASLVLNGVTFIVIIVMYYIEYQREHWCIEELDINPAEPDDNLFAPGVKTPPSILDGIKRKNTNYFYAACFACTFTAVNLTLSVVYLVLNFGGAATVTSLMSFSLLVIGKLYRSLMLSYKGISGKEKCIRSAYMMEYAAFNVIDEDKRHLHEYSGKGSSGYEDADQQQRYSRGRE